REVEGRTRVVGKVTPYGRVIGRHQRRTDHYGDVDWLTGANMAFRRELAVHDEGLRMTANGLSLANDLDSCLAVKRAGARILYSPWAVVEHHTTSFRDSVLGSRVAGPDVVTSAANHTYAVCKSASAWPRFLHAVYAYGIGAA